MRKKNVIMQIVSLLSLTALFVAPVISCGGGASSSGPNTVTYASASQAASGGSSAKASVDLSNSISTAASDLSSSSNPSGYAPGKGGSAAIDTTSIAALDPRLKGLVDKMLVRMQAPAVKNAVSKARSFKTMSQPLSSATVTVSASCPGGGTYQVTGTDTSSTGVYKEYTVDILFTACTDTTASTNSKLDGTLHVYDKEMIASTSITRNASVNLTAQNYISSALDTTDVMNGTFNGTDTGTAGTDYANGSFSETDAGTGNVATFYFTNMSGAWSKLDDPGVSTTIIKTVNGNYGFSITSTDGTFGLDIGLSNLQDKLKYNWVLGVIDSVDQWINGSITITWTPDLSALGCLSGTITFTTDDLTPIHMPVVAYFLTCPTSGVLRINNATIEYGKPSGTQVTVTVGTDSKVYSSCNLLPSGGLCQ